MCGICAYIGFANGYKQIYSGLQMLQNRGYDSAGICGINDENNFIIRKYASTEDVTAVEMLKNMDFIFGSCDNIIAHSRWACQGGKTDINAHPHLDYTGNISIVHNGIIENYEEIRDEMFKNYGIICKSQTDTEVIANLISLYYNKVKNTELAIKLALDRLEGTWGLVILNKDEPNKVFCARHGSPLLIGLSSESKFAMIVSEQSGFCKSINEYVCLNNGDIVILEKDYSTEKIIFDKKTIYKFNKVLEDDSPKNPGKFPYWTIKEICEQPVCVSGAICNLGRLLNDYMVKLGGLEPKSYLLKDADHLVLLGCGSSYYAGLHVLNLFRKISMFSTCQIFDGGEFSLSDLPKTGKICVVLLSQSGETRDLYQSLILLKNLENIITVGVVNVVDSLIAREVDCGVYLYAGKEIGVASTKVFMSQVVILHLLAIFFCQIKDNSKYVDERKIIIKDIIKLKDDVYKTIEMVNECCSSVADQLIKKAHKNMFILGKGWCESIAKEGSLKIKEIGYIHAEGYSSTSLKHGPYSLIEKDSPVMIINLNDIHKVSNNIIIDEINAREGYIINIGDDDKAMIKICHSNTFGGLLSVIPFQLIAYYLAVYDGRNPDLPRNLAKTVTVV